MRKKRLRQGHKEINQSNETLSFFISLREKMKECTQALRERAPQGKKKKNSNKEVIHGQLVEVSMATGGAERSTCKEKSIWR